MTDVSQQATPPAMSRAPAVLSDPIRAAFWGALALAIGASGVALAAGAAIGPMAATLLLAVAGIAVVFLVWLSRGAGRVAGLFPARGALQALSVEFGACDAAPLEALDEPALMTDRAGAARAANGAYRALMAAFGEAAAAPLTPERLFAGDPAMGPPLFRLARAAATSQQHVEALPATKLGPEQAPVRFELRVGPAGGGRTLWRLRRLEAPAVEAPRPAEAEATPLAFLAARADGLVTHVNPLLRQALQVDERGVELRVRDLLSEETLRALRRERLEGALTPVVFRDAHGRPVPAQAIVQSAGLDAGRGLQIFALLGAPAAVSAPAAEIDDVAWAFVFERAPFGVAVVAAGDPAEAALVDANPALADLTQGAAAPGARLAALFEAPENEPALADRLRRAVTGAHVELSLAVDPPKAVQLHFARLSDGRGLAYIADVAEQRDLETRLAQSEKMREIGLLAGGVAHDFNNLLHVMIQRTHMLRLRHPVGDPDYHDLSIIHDHVMRAKELSEMLRAYARQQTFKLEIIEAAPFVQQMHELARRLCGEGIECLVQHEPNLPFVKVDKSQLERVLINLISNGRDAMTPKDSGIPKSGTLTLRTRRVDAAEVRSFSRVPIEDGEYVAIDVSDTGVGIKPEDQHKIFHPFHSTKDPTKGTGLGLATSYGIIKQSGGYIFFSSEPGQGTTFSIFLPAYEPSAAELDEMARREREAHARPALDVTGRGRILFVEDDDFVREATAANLKQFGYEIIEAESGFDGLDLLKETPARFDMIITDVSMPGMSGVEMVRAAGPELLGRTPILFMTGFSVENTLPNGDGVSYISKPVDATELARKVKEMLTA